MGGATGGWVGREAASKGSKLFLKLFEFLCRLVSGIGPCLSLLPVVLVGGIGSAMMLSGPVLAAFVPLSRPAAGAGTKTAATHFVGLESVTCFSLVLFVLSGAGVLAAGVATETVPEGAVATFRRA